MILSDIKIMEAINKGEIVIDPFDRDCLGTNSYDVHLGKWLAYYKDHILDARKHNPIEYVEIPKTSRSLFNIKKRQPRLKRLTIGSISTGNLNIEPRESR